MQDTAVIESLTRNASGQLDLCLGGQDEPVTDVRITRCFPRSFPDGYVSIRDKDGHEVLLLEMLDGVPEDVRALIEEELHDKVFCPGIRRIVSSTREFGVVSLCAETDRGTVTFQRQTRQHWRS